MKPQRQLILVDGLIAGEGDGPMACDPKPCGVLAGTHPVALDCVSARLMGFDWRKTGLLAGSFTLQELPLCAFQPTDIRVSSNNPDWNVDAFEKMTHTLDFRCHFGWQGHLELKKAR